MNAPIRSMADPVAVPIAGETIATISSYPELVDAFRTIKARLGLSNKWCDDVCDIADGHTDKVLGPTQAKNITPILFSMFCQVFAVRFRMEVDPAAVRKMEAEWQKREEGKVAFPEWRISKKLVKKAKPLVMKETGQLGGMVTAYMRTPEQRSEAARKAAKSRWKKARKNRVRC